MIADELSDPARDCKKFDQSKRARELFNALDDDGNGFLTEDEFITGCMSDEAFVKVCYYTVGIVNIIQILSPRCWTSLVQILFGDILMNEFFNCFYHKS